MKIIKTRNQSILKGSSIEYYNDRLIKEYKKHNITKFVVYQSEKLKTQVEESYNFMKGPIGYLSEVDKQNN